MNTPQTAVVKITAISSNNYFKVSRKNYPDNLIYSLKHSGMLEIPFLIKTDSGYDIFTCHNRIQILRDSGMEELTCFILGKADVELFMKHVSLKAYRNELGPYGKLKVLSVLNTYFKTDQQTVKNYCIKVLKLPLDVIENGVYLSKILSFPASLIDYLDEKDISFKTIKDLSRMPDDWLSLINNWLNSLPVRVNIFRMLCDYLFDIYRRGDNIPILEISSYSDDKALYDAVFRIRHPEFSMLKSRSESIINDLSRGGISVDFPEYFERKNFTIKLDIDKRSDCELQLKKIIDIDAEKIKDLISLL
ncbi:MAG: hypothetical protein CVV49_05785 [Spirochaetae bacterium HGW-Spirochaetae-5]|nr:MAG: hypothetical protein CVV49_05785 [Spirochaetae bacterium HGW-Spirochaetae-5]